MKKTILLSAMAVAATMASAQYTCDPTTEALLQNGTPSKMWYITLGETSISELEKSGVKMEYIGPDANAGRNFWYWAGWTAGPETNPRVGFEDGGYISLTVTGDAGWSGGGIAINGPMSADKGPGVDFNGLDDNTHFHFAFCTNGTAPSSVAMILLDDSANGSQPAKFSFGKEAFIDNGAVIPQVAGEITDEWQGVDITLGNLKKLWPIFSPNNLNAWGGNVLSMLSGNVAQTNFCLDAIYFYNLGDSGVKGINADATILIGKNTINAIGADGISVWDATGKLVKKTSGFTLGIDSLPGGLYIVKAGNTVKKIVK